jgi:hypothetical protein
MLASESFMTLFDVVRENASGATSQVPGRRIEHPRGRSTREASRRYLGSFIGFYHSGWVLQFYIGCILIFKHQSRKKGQQTNEQGDKAPEERTANTFCILLFSVSWLGPGFGT